MDEVSITYSKNIPLYIQIKHNGLYINSYYAKDIDPDFLKGILYSEGYYSVPDSVIEDIKTYSDNRDSDKDVTVVFTYTSY